MEFLKNLFGFGKERPAYEAPAGTAPSATSATTAATGGAVPGITTTVNGCIIVTDGDLRGSIEADTDNSPAGMGFLLAAEGFTVAGLRSRYSMGDVSRSTMRLLGYPQPEGGVRGRTSSSERIYSPALGDFTSASTEREVRTAGDSLVVDDVPPNKSVVPRVAAARDVSATGTKALSVSLLIGSPTIVAQDDGNNRYTFPITWEQHVAVSTAYTAQAAAAYDAEVIVEQVAY